MRTKLFVPGLGGTMTLNRQAWVVSRWNSRNLTAYMFDPRWHDKETVEDKLRRLFVFMDEHNLENVELLAASAGGPLALCALAEQPDRFVSCKMASPKLVGSATIGPAFQKRSPGLMSTVELSEKMIGELDAIQIRKITVYRPLIEFVVPLGDMIFPGVSKRRLPIIGHVTIIAFCLLFIFRR